MSTASQPARPILITAPANLSIAITSGMTFSLGFGLLMFGAVIPGGLLATISMLGLVFGVWLFRTGQEVFVSDEGISARVGPARLVRWSEIERVEHADKNRLRIVLAAPGRESLGTRAVELRARYRRDLSEITEILNEEARDARSGA